MSKTTIEDPTVRLRPSQRLVDYIYELDEHSMPENVRAIYMAKHKSKKRPALFDEIIPSVQFTQSEVKILKSLNDDDQQTVEEPQPEAIEKEVDLGHDYVLERNDLKWLHQVLATKRQTTKAGEPKVYLHELLADCQLVLPENQVLKRNPVLEERCKKLRLQQSNREYHEMTKNVDNVRKHLPEETIAFQMKQINRHLIGVAQFLFSVAAGFAFGFIGIELIIGNLDFGFRLLLGIMIALIIALAEIYFLAKTLNEEYEVQKIDPALLAKDGDKVVKETIVAAALGKKLHAE